MGCREKHHADKTLLKDAVGALGHKASSQEALERCKADAERVLKEARAEVITTLSVCVLATMALGVE